MPPMLDTAARDGRTVEVDERGLVRYVTIQRPPVNALSAREYQGLREAFTACTDARVCVLRGSGPTFCSGQDLVEAAGLDDSQVGPHLAAAGAAIAAVARSPLPLVAVVGGPAVGAGALLICLADVIVMSDKAWLSFPEARHGLPVGLSLLSRLVPARLAGQLLATGDRIFAQRLSTLGVVDHLVDAGRLDEVAAEVVSSLVDLPAAMSQWLFSTPQRVEREQAYLAEVRAAAGAGAWRR